MRLLRLSILFILCALLPGLLSGLVFAATPKGRVQNTPVTVLELFTSQGCSSCPAANKFVRELAQDGDVLTLSYSVDYWDYLGWKDTFGKPEFSARQRTYGKQFGGQVYTPQMVVNGALHSTRLSDKKVRAQHLDNAFEISINADGENLYVQVFATPQLGKVLSVMAVRYKPGVQSVPVKRGENRGRIITLANVVQACQEIGRIELAKAFHKTIPALAEGEALAIFVQDGKGGPILGAANYLPDNTPKTNTPKAIK